MRTSAETLKTTQPATSAKPFAASQAHIAPRHDSNLILKLQRTMGNRAVLRLLQRKAEERDAVLTTHQFGTDSARIPASPDQTTLQTNLSVSEPDDEYEQEADRVADQVMRMPAPQVQRACSCGERCSKCQSGQPEQGHEHPQIMRLATGDSEHSDVSPLTEEILQQPGQPLDDSARSYFEPRFGHDFSQVRVHSGSQAEQAARSVNARAFTVGNHIVFGAGQPSTNSSEGQRLLAHELTHVIQQSGGSGTRVSGSPAGQGLVQRDPEEAEPTPGEPTPAEPTQAAPSQRTCGPDITTSLTTMLGTVGPWFRRLSTFEKHRSCMGLGPGRFLVGVNPVMDWATLELFLPNTGWLDGYFRSRSCGSPRDSGCATDPSRHQCETAGSCGNSVVVGGKCMLAGTANYTLVGQ